MAIIKYSVGKGGRNHRADVFHVQDLLNDHCQPPLRLIAEDGLVGRETIGAISEFQRRVLHKTRPDGRVDPGYATIRALSNNPPRSPAQTKPRGVPVTHAASHKSAMREEFRKAKKDALWKEYWKFVVADATPEAKRFFSMIGRAEEARKIARFYIVLREDLKVGPREMKQIFQAISGTGNPRWTKNFVEFLAEPATKSGAVLKKMATVGKAAAFIIFLIEYMDHWSKGDYHMALPELYKTFMGERIPWAGYIDTIQSFLGACLPKKYQTERSYKALKALNPIDLGAQGVDSICVTAHVLVVLFVDGKIDEKRIYRLADRVKKSSAGIFYDIGDDLAKALATMADMPDNEFDDMMSAGNVFAWLNDFWLTKYTPSLVIYRLVRDQMR